MVFEGSALTCPIDPSHLPKENVIMKSNRIATRFTRPILLIALVAALAAAFVIALPKPVQADDLVLPDVPENLQVPEGNRLFFVGNATGTQNYICLPITGGGVGFVLFTPQATLFNDENEQAITHYFGPNPDEAGAIRAAWQHSKDSSTVWGRVFPGNSSTDPDYVAPGAIAWLLVTIVGHEDGPDDGDRLSATTYIQRVNTSGGVAPLTGCSMSDDIGNQAFVPYTTDYYFYKK
jgi:hypothetical protein